MKRWRTLTLLLALLAALLAFRKPITHRVAVEGLLRSDPPSSEGFGAVAAESREPLRFFERAWNEGGIVHRQLTLQYLSKFALSDPALLSSGELIVAEAVVDPDLTVRERALSLLPHSNFDWLAAAAAAQMADADPEVRRLGLGLLRELPDGQALALAARLLEDTDPLILTLVDSVFRRVTGIDNGVRIHDSIARVQDEDSPNLASIQAALEPRRSWWANNAYDFPMPRLPPLPQRPKAREPVGPFDFDLPKLDGGRLHLAELRGKPVWINFWATWCTACAREIPTLNRLHNTYADDLTILGISLDGVPDAHGHLNHGAEAVASGEPDTGHGDEAVASADLEAARRIVDRFRRKTGIQYTLLLDPSNEVGARFNGGELPTNVILDSDGHLRRRFLGDRSFQVFRAMAEGVGCASQSSPD